MKDHEIAQVINTIRDIATEFSGTQQLRERIAGAIRPLLSDPAQQLPAVAVIIGYVQPYVIEKGLGGYTATLNPVCEGVYTVAVYGQSSGTKERQYD